MVAIAFRDGPAASMLRAVLLGAGFPAFITSPGETESARRADCIVTDGDCPSADPFCSDPERVIFSDGGAIVSREPGRAPSEIGRITERIVEVLEIKSGVVYGNYSRGAYVERDGVSVYIGRVIPLTERERLIARLLTTHPGGFFSAETVAACCFPAYEKGRVPTGAVRTAVSSINASTKALTGFPLIVSRPREGYSFTG